MLLSCIIEYFTRERATTGWLRAALRFGGALRAVRYRRPHRELFELDIYRKYIVRSENRDALFHLSHRHYVSTRFRGRQRIDAVLDHYRYESRNYDRRYKEAVYREGGLLLWRRWQNGIDYAIRLRSSDQRQEGANGVFLHAGEVCLSEMSFTWIDGAVFGTEGCIPFITKNQSVPSSHRELDRFRDAFPHNSPAYFCFSAIQGIAMANGVTQIAGIRHDCQIAYEDAWADSFRNAYTGLWKSFSGVEVDGHAYLMPVPMRPTPIPELKSKRRARALRRRALWSEIADSAAAVTAAHCNKVAGTFADGADGADVAGAVQVSE